MTLFELPLKELEDMDFLCEIIVVDVGSVDSTREKTERVHNVKKDVRLESLYENRNTF